MLPQDPVYFHTSIIKNVTLNRTMPLFDYFKLLFEILECDSYIDYSNFKINNTDSYVTLSGGEKRRIFLLRAFYKKYDNYILDESFVGIQKSIIDRFFDFIFSVNMNILVITHDENIINKVNNNYIYDKST
ncbi:hypothetical protein [Polynucleobacter paludilacus]|uniref:hypothetical protein n=1 Tax=Polynucleobacter paludilacus TaxID=1855895 RepID=UPI001BFCFC17|nr:hypothetical protein [Polynucleobacter paludilacus]